MPRDVFFQVNVVDTLGNCLTQQRQAVDVAGGPLAAIFFAAAGRDDGAAAIGEQAFDVHRAADVVQTQLDQLSPLFSDMASFCNHATVATTADTNANHEAGISVEVSISR